MNEIQILKDSMEITRIIMLCTVVMAVITVTFSALNLAFQRSHNRKTTRPFCHVEWIFKNDAFCLVLSNSGLGPLLVVSITASRLDGTPAPLETASPAQADLIVSDLSGVMIGPSEHKNLIQINCSNPQAIPEDQYALFELQLTIQYEDVYKDKFTFQKTFNEHPGIIKKKLL